MGITNRFRERLLSCAPLVKRDSYESRDARTCFFCNDDLGLGPRSPVIQRSPKKSAHRYTLRMNFLKREFTIGSVCYKIRRAKKTQRTPILEDDTFETEASKFTTLLREKVKRSI